MSDAPELLPCPFCGGDAGTLTDATRILGRWNLVHSCPVIGPLKIERATRDAVVAAWNRRATPAALDRLADADMAQAALVERAAEHIAAIERLAISASIASCTCHTKTPDITFHAADCRYVKLQYIIAQCEDFRDSAEAAAMNGETT